MRQFFVFIFSLVFSVPLIAGEVNLPHTFQPNTKAKAGEVNANFNAVRDAVNDNNSRISNLENTASDHGTRIQNLESRKILSVTYPPTCFNMVMGPDVSLPYYSTEVSDAYVALFNTNSTNDNQTILCPVTLPEGSRILKIIAYVFDGAAGGRISLSLIHFPYPSSHASYGHDFGTTNDGGHQQLILDFSSDPEIIERGVSYSIQADFTNDGMGFDLHIDHIIVIYEYDPTYSGPAP